MVLMRPSKRSPRTHEGYMVARGYEKMVVIGFDKKETTSPFDSNNYQKQKTCAPSGFCSKPLDLCRLNSNYFQIIIVNF